MHAIYVCVCRKLLSFTDKAHSNSLFVDLKSGSNDI